ncbi:MAG: hydrogenase maturation protease [Thermoanaerobaculia bacterium]|jgi:hydrogenase maturation protease|nr:hydrogenase maturation protease [Thermoanaerobaculia bacterium]
MRTAILALGSVLMSDDGVGPTLLAWLEAHWELPPEVERFDLGTPGPELADWLSGREAVIFLDAARLSGAPPGEVRLFSRRELATLPRGPHLSPHDPGLGEALLKADFAGDGPREAAMVGIVPARIGLGTELSASVAAALPAAAAAVVAELARLGHAAHPRERPEPLRAFWTAGGEE